MGICSRSTLFNFAVVTDEMLTGGRSIREVAKTLATAVSLAVQAHCKIILFGIEVRHSESCEWRTLRESLQGALAAGSVGIFPAGNRSGGPDVVQCRWPEAVVVASHNWRGIPSLFSPLMGGGVNTVFAPGENVPGAGPGSGYVVRSGTSFAAAIAAGAFALATCVLRACSVFEIAVKLCPRPHRVLDGTVLLGEMAHTF
jgi:hypothetical protein